MLPAWLTRLVCTLNSPVSYRLLIVSLSRLTDTTIVQRQFMSLDTSDIAPMKSLFLISIAMVKMFSTIDRNLTISIP